MQLVLTFHPILIREFPFPFLVIFLFLSNLSTYIAITYSD